MPRRSTRRSGGSSGKAPKSPASSPEPKRRRTAADSGQDEYVDSRSHVIFKMGASEGLEGRTKVLSDDKFRALNKALKIDKKKPQASQLKPEEIDFHVEQNRKAHRTEDYEHEQLIIRRGQEFEVTVKFNREYKPDSDVVVLQFVTGRRPQESKGSVIRALLRQTLSTTQWGIKVKQVSGKTVRFTVMPSAKAMIGQYEVFVETIMNDADGSKLVFRYKDDDKVCVLFNAWCKDDVAYMENDVERNEYVLADTGNIWVGSSRHNTGIPWTFGQFEDVSLDCALWLLNKAHLSPFGRSSPVSVVRVISAMANYNDSDGGILFGRWTETYPKNTTKPTAWTGSVEILEKFWKKKFNVKYGQCWVFSGLVTTLLRALGLPTRSVTNFESAHDTDGSMTIDFHFDEEGNPLNDLNDSIWNFHVWNESWFKRTDLPDGHDGWQAHDATPQETSEGVFRCGPASVNAIKNGEVYLPYDTGFIFAEVNGDRVYWDVDDDDGSMKAHYIDKYSIGKYISTKMPGSTARLDVTRGYKHPEGSQKERDAVEFANKFSTRRELDIYKADKEDVQFSLQVADDIDIGDSFDVKVVVQNKSSEKRTVRLNITSVLAFYTGMPARDLKQKRETLHLAGKEEKSVILKIAAADYIGKLAADGNIKLFIKGTVAETEQRFATQDVVEMRKPSMTVTVSPKSAKRGDSVHVKAFFNNSLPVSLKNGKFHFSVSGMYPKSMEVDCPGPVASKKEAKAEVSFTVTRGWRTSVVVSFTSDQLSGVRGNSAVNAQR